MTNSSHHISGGSETLTGAVNAYVICGYIVLIAAAGFTGPRRTLDEIASRFRNSSLATSCANSLGKERKQDARRLATLLLLMHA
jgi:hypothetical protein